MISAPRMLSINRYISASNWPRLRDMPEDDEEAEDAAGDNWDDEDMEEDDE